MDWGENWAELGGIPVPYWEPPSHTGNPCAAPGDACALLGDARTALGATGLYWETLELHHGSPVSTGSHWYVLGDLVLYWEPLVSTGTPSCCTGDPKFAPGATGLCWGILELHWFLLEYICAALGNLMLYWEPLVCTGTSHPTTPSPSHRVPDTFPRCPLLVSPHP